jgi:hypothetical protein
MTEPNTDTGILAEFAAAQKRVRELEAQISKAKGHATNGLVTDGAMHKQWYLEKILVSLGTDMEKLKKEMNDSDYDWDEGVAP